MQQSTIRRPTAVPAIIGLLLVAVGAVALVLRELVGVNLFASIGPWGWPFFVIVPGLVLLGASLLPAPPRGLGFAIAGGVVTTVGGLLLYQSQSGHWESWAYAWALIPAGAGLAMLVYGQLTGTRGLARNGLTLAAIGAALFATGAWFFEGIFAGEPRPLDAGNWWPVGVIALGAILLIRAIAFPTPAAPPADAPAPEAPTPL